MHDLRRTRVLQTRLIGSKDKVSEPGNIADDRTFPIPLNTYSHIFTVCNNLIWASFGAIRAAFEQNRPFSAPLTCIYGNKVDQKA